VELICVEEYNMGCIFFHGQTQSNPSGRSFRLRPAKKNSQIGSHRVWPVKKNSTIFVLFAQARQIHHVILMRPENDDAKAGDCEAKAKNHEVEADANILVSRP